MLSYIFASSNDSIEKVTGSIEALDEACTDFFEVVLSNESEFNILMGLLGLEGSAKVELSKSTDFSVSYDYSASLLPEQSTEEFDEFYELWLKKTGRDSSMDEYGQLVFIQGHASLWNKRINRFVLQAKP